MAEFGYDPSSGSRGTSLPIPGAGRSTWSGPDRAWQVPDDLVSAPAADSGPGYGAEASTCPVPENIVYRGATEDWTGGSGFDADHFVDALSGDEDVHDTEVSDASDDYSNLDETDTDKVDGPVAANEVCCDQRGLHTSAHGIHLNLGTLGR
jgi:hypothetical protein